MKRLLSLLVGLAVTPLCHAFPPAPHHEIYGLVRDNYGHPLVGGATVFVSGDDRVLTQGLVDPSIRKGVNYSLKVPMDSGTLDQLYHPTALQPTMPFTIRVQIGNVSYVPIEVTANGGSIGEPSDRTRLDLTLGVDSDGDGISDAWEYDLITSSSDPNLKTLADVRPDDDSDGDGISNLGEYVAGTYAFDEDDKLHLEILEVANGQAHLRFLAITGRTYSLEKSEDTKNYTPLKFTTEAGATADLESHLASEVTYLDVYTPIADEINQTFFVLNVE